MLYFRDEETEILNRFIQSDRKRAMAIYGRRRTGKTELVLDYLSRYRKPAVYYQCTSFDYRICLEDFKRVIGTVLPQEGSILESLSSFRDVFLWMEQSYRESVPVFIDEFPFLCKRNGDVVLEFQWIIDHALKKSKLILLGSNLSFMKHQITDREAPLYGRFDDMIEIRPFSFPQVHVLFPDFDDAVRVFSQTGGVAQYVMFFRDYATVDEASESLFFNRNGRLLQEAGNMLMQELRDTTTYTAILRAIGGSAKDSGQIAAGSGLDSRGVFSYLNKLIDLEIVELVENPLSPKKKDRRYRISDQLFRFSYTFIEPGISMISAIGSQSRKHILDERYREYLGFVYEDIIRLNCYSYGLTGRFPFMPIKTGKWWGSILRDGQWTQSEVDVIAYDDDHIIVGECKYRRKMAGVSELEELRAKIPYIPVKGRQVICMMASRSGFTKELKNRSGDDLILIEQI